MRILIVDDSEIELALLENSLRRAGHVVDQATNGEDALAMLQRDSHRLVITDWDMPKMDGLALCRAARATMSTYVYCILLTSHNGSDEIVTGLSAGADDFLSKPYNPAELLVRIRGAERVLSLETRDMTIFAMAKLAESRDRETGQHLERVRIYAESLARRLLASPKFQRVIDERFVHLIYETSPLHDIGKVGIPDQILLKPGKLTAEEYAIMQTHTTLGAATLDAALQRYPDADFLRFARDIAACHHERYDGSGYPRGLLGEEIPLCARVVAVADVYDAVTSNRIYRKAMTHDEARQLILDGSGKHFDPDVVSAFFDLEDQFVAICREFKDEVEERPANASSLVMVPA
jgi:putative two-component system response regulator